MQIGPSQQNLMPPGNAPAQHSGSAIKGHFHVAAKESYVGTAVQAGRLFSEAGRLAGKLPNRHWFGGKFQQISIDKAFVRVMEFQAEDGIAGWFSPRRNSQDAVA